MRRTVAACLMPLGLAACVYYEGPQPPGTLLLTNRDLPATRVEAVVTKYLDCDLRGPGVVGSQNFVLPPDATRKIYAPAGADICWRYDRKPRWLGWDRAYVAPGRTVDSTL